MEAATITTQRKTRKAKVGPLAELLAGGRAHSATTQVLQLLLYVEKHYGVVSNRQRFISLLSNLRSTVTAEFDVAHSHHDADDCEFTEVRVEIRNGQYFVSPRSASLYAAALPVAFHSITSEISDVSFAAESINIYNIDASHIIFACPIADEVLRSHMRELSAEGKSEMAIKVLFAYSHVLSSSLSREATDEAQVLFQTQFKKATEKSDSETAQIVKVKQQAKWSIRMAKQKANEAKEVEGMSAEEVAAHIAQKAEMKAAVKEAKKAAKEAEQKAAYEALKIELRKEAAARQRSEKAALKLYLSRKYDKFKAEKLAAKEAKKAEKTTVTVQFAKAA